MQEIEARIVEILYEKYGWTREEIFEKDDFEALGMDSLSLYSLVEEVEEEFAIEIDTDDITEINTPSGLISYVTKKSGEKNNG